jgi:hypothetical protein
MPIDTAILRNKPVLSCAPLGARGSYYGRGQLRPHLRRPLLGSTPTGEPSPSKLVQWAEFGRAILHCLMDTWVLSEPHALGAHELDGLAWGYLFDRDSAPIAVSNRQIFHANLPSLPRQTYGI